MPLYREHLQSFKETTFSITIDKSLVKDDSLISFEKINEALKIQTADFLKLIKVFEDKLDIASIYLPNELPDDKISLYPNLCIGGGAGFLTKTIIYAIAPNQNDAIDAIKQFLDKSFTKFDQRTKQRMPDHGHNIHDKKISPRTLKLVKEDNDYLNIGWCCLEEVK